MTDETLDLEMNEIELAEKRLLLVKTWFQEHNNRQNTRQITDPTRQSSIDLKYEEHLLKDLQAKKNFLNIAKRENRLNSKRKISTKAAIVGTILANDRLPFKQERDDNIDIALANSVYKTQVDQSIEIVRHLKSVENRLNEELSQQQKIHNDLESVIQLLQDRLENGSNEDSTGNEENLENLLSEEKARYRKLREHLKDLISKYEGYDDQ